jgi:hypothetical protein
MKHTDAELIRKVEEKQADLVAVYESVYRALRRLDRSAYSAAALADLDHALESPESIAPAKAVAVLKAILGTTSQDKLRMETFHGAPLDGTSSVGAFVRGKVQGLGLGYHDFWPYLYATGWATPPPDPI